MEKKKELQNRLLNSGPFDRQLAIDRVKRCHALKRKWIKYPDTPEDEYVSITYTRPAFLELLKKIFSDPHTTGLRIYFACYTKSIGYSSATGSKLDKKRIPQGKDGNLLFGGITLVFAPTSYNTSDMDDSGDYYIFNAAGDAILQLGKNDNPTEPKAWVKAYRDTIWDDLNNDPDVTIDGDKDTKSLWYSTPIIKDMHYNMMQSQSDYITAFFSTYLDTEVISVDLGSFGHNQSVEPHNQLSLIFGTGKMPLEGMQLVDPEDYDTGAPCPPSQSCGGSEGLP